MITKTRIQQLKNTVANIVSELTRRITEESNPTVKALMRHARGQAEELLDTIDRIDTETDQIQ